MLLKINCCKWQLSARTAGPKTQHSAAGTPHCPGNHHKSCVDISAVTCADHSFPTATLPYPQQFHFPNQNRSEQANAAKTTATSHHVPQERTGAVRLEQKVVIWIPNYSQIQLFFPKSSYKPSHTSCSPDFPCHAKLGKSLIIFLTFLVPIKHFSLTECQVSFQYLILKTHVFIFHD